MVLQSSVIFNSANCGYRRAVISCMHSTKKERIAMRVTDIWKTKQKPTISFELFPARTPKAAVNLEKAIDNLADLEPDFVSVTFGAGGSTREGSRELVGKLKNEKGLEVVAYVACFGLGPADLESVLDDYRGMGVENILAVRGDIPRDEEDFTPHPDSLPHASDFLPFVKSRHSFCPGAAGYPEGHIQAESEEKDLEFLKLKVDHGAEYIITNYFYDNRYYFDFIDRCRSIGIIVPIIPGVMPVFNVKLMKNLAELCGATITDELTDGLSALPDDDKEALSDFGARFAESKCRELIKSGAPGLHIYTMDRSKSSKKIVGTLREEGLL